MRKNRGLWIFQMQLLLATLLSLATFMIVNHGAGDGAGTAWKADSYTTHIGSRVPPVEANCMPIDEITTDEGKQLSVYACPTKVLG